MRVHLIVCFFGFTPFLLVFYVCIPTYTFFCLFFGSNSLLAGVLHLYTCVYVLLSTSSILLRFCRYFAFVYPCIHSFVCFFGLTLFLQVFYACIPTYTFYLSVFGSNSLLADIWHLYTCVYILLSV